ncbi:MAG: 60S ribosomal export protein NMD3 [Methanolinea sp.]|nr:60S ribosomal export protein NMD3 [Methanolinea sp.]
MSIKDSMCPLCGRPSPNGEICGTCRVAKTRWLECPARVRIVVCPTCGAHRQAGAWVDERGDDDELVFSLVRQSLSLHRELSGVTFSLSRREKSPNRTLVECTVRGTLFSVPVEGTCGVEVEWKKEQCDRCSLISGNYYEGIVQLRATGRKPAPREIKEARRIASETLGEMVASGERLAFITKWDEHRDGLDITVGSQRLGREIAHAITQSLGGKYSAHPKLVGEKAGRQLFRVTYLVRLPRFSPGDVLTVRGRHVEVIGLEGRLLRCIDIDSGTVRLVGEGQVERRVGRREDSVRWEVVFRDRELLGLLDPATGTTHEVMAPLRGVYPPGSIVHVLLDREVPVILP